MKVNVVYPLLGLAALAVWIKPDQPATQPARAAAPLTAATAAKRIDVAQTSDWASGQSSLPRNADGHFYAEVTVDGSSTHMLVDTGASVVALTGSDAEAAGLTWQPDDVKPVARGANGEVDGVRVKLDHVQLGDLELRDVDAIVVPQGLGVSLLGQSFLQRIGKVEIGNDKMVLGQ